MIAGRASGGVVWAGVRRVTLGCRRPYAELVGVVLGLVLFSWLHSLLGLNVESASAHAEVLQSMERSMNLDIEVVANQWLAGRPSLIPAAVVYYRVYYLPVFLVVLWAFFRHVEVFRTVVRILMVMTPLALLVFWLVPMSPPRFALPGILDIVAQHDPVAGRASRDLTNGQNHFSAMPSLHVGWAALGAYIVWLIERGRHTSLALLAWLFPAVMVAVVITTGNHYVLDVVGSALLLAVSIAAAGAIERRRSALAQVCP